jgi:hypothetical protein
MYNRSRATRRDLSLGNKLFSEKWPYLTYKKSEARGRVMDGARWGTGRGPRERERVCVCVCEGGGEVT